MIRISLRRLFPEASFVGGADLAVAEATADNRQCTPGCLFAVIQGRRDAGQRYVEEAIARGATALLCSAPIAAPVPQCVVPNVRQAYAELCQALHGSPSQKLGLVGVTGTNGKTTVSWMVRSILEQAGKPTGVLGTIHYHDGIESAPSELTTPDSRSLAKWLAAMADKRTGYAAIELSSHALDQYRPAGIALDVAIITNITQDHFDYHFHYENYRSAKSRVLQMLKPGGLVLFNADDPGSESLISHSPMGSQVCTFGIKREADLSARILELTTRHSSFEIQAGLERVTVTMGLIGRHNISNALAAAGAVLHFGVSLPEIKAGLEQLTSIPGRMQRVEADKFDVFVDYAHTDDALRRAVTTLREVSRGRVICVFGAGGDRDASKRALMGRSASLAHQVVVTSDNPRGEDPHQIIQEICAGLRGVGVSPHVEPDRELAIAWALKDARPGDAVLIAGKGHETVQIIGREKFPFDDVAVCERLLAGTPMSGPHWDGILSGMEVQHADRR